jgi:hypothetical protein
MAQSGGGASSLITLGVLAVGGYFVYEMFFASPAAATAAPAIPATPATPATPAATPAKPVSNGSLNAIFTSILNLIQNTYKDTANFTGAGSALTGTPAHFNVYLKLASPGAVIPDLGTVFGTSASSPMTAAAYWNLMGPALAAANPSLGLSGLGLAGLGMLIGGRR